MAGLLAGISPCILPVLPVILAGSAAVGPDPAAARAGADTATAASPAVTGAARQTGATAAGPAGSAGAAPGGGTAVPGLPGKPAERRTGERVMAAAWPDRCR